MKIRLSYQQWAVTALLFAAAGCSSDDITTEKTAKPAAEENETEQTGFVAGTEGTRTSLDYDTRDFFWEEGDRIYVQDDGNVFQHSSNAVTGTKQPAFKFLMPGTYTHNSYTVYYPGKNGTGNNVTIASAQTQNGPDNTLHFGISGDCGTGTATRQPNGQYKFQLNHAAAYLCFKPTYSHPLASTYVTKIEVTANKNIAGAYTLGTNGRLTGTGSSQTITLTPKTAGSSDGFAMQNNAAGTSCEAGRMFMVIMPGKYKLTIKYYVRDKETGVSGVITKTFGEFQYDANGYYDMPAALSIRYYDDKYYAWDAKKEYWSGHKNDQPKKTGVQGSNYPTSADGNRWYNTSKDPNATANTAKTCPNANELVWYCLKGDPHWDNKTLWTVWGHLYTGGMWFKKASVIASENGKGSADKLKEKAPSGTDYVHTQPFITPPDNKNIKQKAPDNRSNYFFLPAMGRYENGKLIEFGSYGRYWTSTPYKWNKDVSYSLYFQSGNVTVSNIIEKKNGLRLWKTE